MFVLYFNKSGKIVRFPTIANAYELETVKMIPTINFPCYFNNIIHKLTLTSQHLIMKVRRSALCRDTRPH